MAIEHRIWFRLLTATTLLLIALSGLFFERFSEWFPWLTVWQVETYHWISHLEARKPRPKFVIGVEIDDETFYRVMKLASGSATDRALLAQMIRTIDAYHPAVIALDINLTHDPADDRPPRTSANHDLLEAIQESDKAKVPVILTSGFDDASRKQLPNIFPESVISVSGSPTNPFRPRVGFDNSSSDFRKVPLVVDRLSVDGVSREYKSFALQIVDAYESVLGIEPHSVNRLHKEISRREFVYTSFLSQDQFPHISGADVLNCSESSLARLTHRIVLIGGNRHDAQAGEWVDNYHFPPFEMRGMYFQANYVEGLLDDRIRSTVPDWFAFLIDLAVGALMIYFSSQGKNLRARLMRLGVFFIPVILAYIASANFGYVLDFSLPLVLLFLHVFAEHYLHLRFRTQ